LLQKLFYHEEKILMSTIVQGRVILQGTLRLADQPASYWVVGYEPVNPGADIQVVAASKHLPI
jgi:hypothetical protein